MDRFYVTSVEYNKNVQAENRTVPKAFDKMDDARKEYYSKLANNIGNPTLSWCNVIMWDKYGVEIMHEYWERDEEIINTEE